MENNTKNFDEKFEELAAKRKRWVASNEENDFNSFFDYLTNIYPDKAHFIYELLQNAEDMNATEVKFLLHQNKLVFKHNGTKRDFTIDDIVAITGIGNNHIKRLEATAIGKFGIGFKAVFAYTDTPEIHSGNLHFKIENQVVPNKENVENIETVDENGIKWTIFVFPFNIEAKPTEKAFNEISNSLKELDYSSLLFLQHIKKIDYIIDNNEEGYLKLAELQTQNFIFIESSNNTKTTWLRFSEIIENYKDEKGNIKNLPLGIAYKLENSEKNKSYQIQEINGGAFIYFPAIKEYTGLRFLINAPFSSTPSRDSLIDCEGNKELMKEIAKLAVKSLERIKELGLMNNSFFNVLPNGKDNLTLMYSPIYSAIKDAFKEKDYLPTQTGEYVNISNAMIGSKRISDVVDQEFLKSVAGITKKWIQNASVDSNAFKFLHSLDIEEFTSLKFYELFDNNHGSNLESYLGKIKINKTLDEYSKNGIITDEEDENLDNETRKKIVNDAKKNICIWFRKFYDLCRIEYYDFKGFEKFSFVENLKKRKIILSENLKLVKSNEIYFKEKKDNQNENKSENENIKLKDNVEFVNSNIVNQNNKNDLSDNIWQFFSNILSIKTFDTKENILWKLNNKYKSNVSFKLDKDYFFDILQFSLCLKINQDYINFKDYSIFVYYEDGKYYSTKGATLVLSEKYGNAQDKLLAKIYNKKIISDFYYNKLCEVLNTHDVEDDIFYNDMLVFFKYCGVIDSVIVECGEATKHKDFISKLYYQGKRSSSTIDKDYYISNIDMLFKNDGFNKYLWDYLKKQEKSDWALAKYRANAKGETRTCDSTLICDLKEIAWLPDKEGNLHKPADISLEELRDDFKYSDEEKKELVDFEKSPLLKALEIKEKPIDTEKMYEDTANILLSKIGKRAISEERYQKFLKWEQEEAEREERARKRREKNEDLDLITIIDRETKAKKSNDEDEEIISNGAVTNPVRRTEKIENTFKDLKDIKPIYRERFSFVSKSSQDERNLLKEWYKGKCQICGWGKKIRTYNGKPIFEAINIISSNNLPESIKNTEKICWNSLCLCPNCAAMYKSCSKEIKSILEQVEKLIVNQGDSTPVTITFKLDEKERSITFVPKHFLALKTVLNLLKQSQ